MSERNFEFKKLSGGKCQFIMKSDDIERVEIVSEKFAKEHYADLMNQKAAYQQQLGAANRNLEVNKVEKDVELEKFIALADKANKYAKFMKAESDVKGAQGLLDEVEESMHMIEVVFPEWKRMAKK